jgi:DNA topoisomerase-6 subunit A
VSTTLKKLEQLGRLTVQAVDRKKDPFLRVPTRTLANTKFNEKKQLLELGDQVQQREFFNVGQAKKFMQTFLVASACKTLIKADKTTSIRDLYYMTKRTLANSRENTFEEQEESDPIIEDLEVTIDALREELHLFAARRGLMVGEVTVVDKGDTIDLRRQGSGGWGVPSIVEDDVIQFKKCDAKFILLVEKDAVFNRLNEDKFWKKHRCILLHGQGMPPRGVRRLVRRMTEELRLPVFVLVDNDPWGFYIYSVVKQGSINLAYESIRMAVPGARFLGLSSFDAQKYGLKHPIKLNDQDEKRAKQMLAYPWFEKKEWKREIDHMLKSGCKFELEALSGRGVTFISDEYLPRKLKQQDWLA